MSFYGAARVLEKPGAPCHPARKAAGGWPYVWAELWQVGGRVPAGRRCPWPCMRQPYWIAGWKDGRVVRAPGGWMDWLVSGSERMAQPFGDLFARPCRICVDWRCIHTLGLASSRSGSAHGGPGGEGGSSIGEESRAPSGEPPTAPPRLRPPHGRVSHTPRTFIALAFWRSPAAPK